MSYITRIFEIVDNIRSDLGLTRSASWGDAISTSPVKLYAGKLRKSLPQYRTHYGITPFFKSGRNIFHDVTKPYPINSEVVDVYQSEDVFEHVPLSSLPIMLEEIFRILRPGGLFRLSLPDYNFDLNRNRTIKSADGALIFDPDGGGRLVNGEVVDGGHLWFPTIDIVRELFAGSSFAEGAEIRFLHYTRQDGSFVCDSIDHSLGKVGRTPEHDGRTGDRPRPISIVVDAWKTPKISGSSGR